MTLSEPDRAGVLVGNGRCSVRLRRAGPGTEVGVPTLLDVRAGPFSGSVRDDTVGGFSRFRDELRTLHRRLSGTARLTSYEGFSLVLTGDGRGGIDGHVEIPGEHVPPIRLTFGFTIDQSYLPAIVRALDREFLAGDEAPT